MEEWVPLVLQISATVVALASAVVAGVFANRAAKTATTTEARRELLADKQRIYAAAFETLTYLEGTERMMRGDPDKELHLREARRARATDALRLVSQLTLLGDDAVSDYVSEMKGMTPEHLKDLSELMRTDLRNARHELGITKRKRRVIR